MSRKRRSKVRATGFITYGDIARLVVYIILYGNVSVRKKMAILNSNNWKKFHGYPMKRGWREVKC